MKLLQQGAESLYELLVNEEDARSCREISASACRETPRNFPLLLVAYFLTKLGDALANPKTVLPWVMSSVGAPVAMTSFLVPIRESGSLIPQIAIAAWVRRAAVRKWLWVVGAVLQSLAVMGIGVSCFVLEGRSAGAAVLALLSAFSLARGLSSVAAKDVLGKTIPKRQRGQLNGWSASAAGLVTVLVGAGLLLSAGAPITPLGIGLALAGAGCLWIAAAAVYSLVRELPGETEGGANGLVEALGRLSLLMEDAPFRRFVITRALLLCSALSAPFYVVLAQADGEASGRQLGLFIIASGAASLLSAPVWGRFADRSSRTVMAAAAGLTAFTGLFVAAAATWLPGATTGALLLPACFFFLSIAHAGVRVGRKTYVVDLASGNRRTDYVAVSNTVIGVLLLAVGGLGALTSLVSVTATILVLSIMGLAGAGLALTLPETQ